MIYVPNKEECVTWNNCGDYIYINWRYHPTDESNNMISFKWYKSPTTHDFSDSFYLCVVGVLNQYVLSCSLNACECNPQLRYNNIIKKWYCNCMSSAICTENDDEDEINELISFAKGEYTEKNGFFDDPIKAILNWNINMAENYKKINEYLMKHPEKESSAYFSTFEEEVNDAEQ